MFLIPFRLIWPLSDSHHRSGMACYEGKSACLSCMDQDTLAVNAVTDDGSPVDGCEMLSVHRENLSILGQAVLAAAILVAVGGVLTPDVNATRANQAPAIADPGAPGQYAAGVTRRTFSRQSSTSSAERKLETVIWYPAEQGQTVAHDPGLGALVDAVPVRKGSSYPVVVWSHCGGECRPWWSNYFTSHLATHGMIVVAPQHPDIFSPCTESCDPSIYRGDPNTKDALDNRPEDLVSVLDQTKGLAASGDPILGGLVDGDRSSLAGHSFGAATVLIAAARHPQFRAALSMAPPDWPPVAEGMSRVSMPTMLMSGMRDHLTPFKQQQNLFEAFATPGPARWLVAFPRGGHASYSNGCPADSPGCGPEDLPHEKARSLVRRWGTAFLLVHVVGDSRYGDWLDPGRSGDDADIEVERRPT